VIGYRIIRYHLLVITGAGCADVPMCRSQSTVHATRARAHGAFLNDIRSLTL
jgi:hypothetical protein